jgi:hypothetical protein
VASPTLRTAIDTAILAAAHVNAHQAVTLAFTATQRLGTLSSGRWRSAARDLERLQADLETAFEQVQQDVARQAESLGVDSDDLWSAGEAAAMLEVFQEGALEWLDEDSAADRLLSGDLIYGVAVLDDPDDDDRGTTLVYTWGDPLRPLAWPWERAFISGSGDDALDLFTAGDVEVSDETLGAVCALLSVQPEVAEKALLEVAEALTRSALLGESDDDEDDEDDDEGGDEPTTVNGQL